VQEVLEPKCWALQKGMSHPISPPHSFKNTYMMLQHQNKRVLQAVAKNLTYYKEQDNLYAPQLQVGLVLSTSV